MYSPRLVTPPGTKPVSLAEVKAHLRIDHADEDAVLGGMLDAAIARFDGWSGILGRCLINQTWSQSHDCWPCPRIPLPFPDVSAVSIAYRDLAGVEQAVPSDMLSAPLRDGCGSFVWLNPIYIRPALHRSPAAITVTLTAGYGAAGVNVPPPIRAAILLMAGHLYQNREELGRQRGVSPASLGIDALVAPYRLANVL